MTDQPIDDSMGAPRSLVDGGAPSGDGESAFHDHDQTRDQDIRQIFRDEADDGLETPEDASQAAAEVWSGAPEDPFDQSADGLVEDAIKPAAANDGPPAAVGAPAAGASPQDPLEDPFIAGSTIGELMYGARVTLGLMSLREIERDLRIKAKFLRAIERVDVEELPSTAYVASFVRSYARFLSDALPLSPDDAVAKFAKEYEEKTGAPLKIVAERDADGDKTSGRTRTRKIATRSSAVRGDEVKDGAGAERRIPKKLFERREEPTKRILKPAYAVRPVGGASGVGRKLSGVAAAGAAMGIVAGLAYGAWSILDKLSPGDATDVVAVAERIDVLAADDRVSRPAAAAYEEGGLFGGAYEPPRPGGGQVARADGPIAQLDPRAVGAFAGAQQSGVAALAARSSVVHEADRAAAGPLTQPVPGAAQPLGVGPSTNIVSTTAVANQTGADAAALELPLAVLEAVASLDVDGAAETQAVVERNDQPAFALRAVSPAWVRVENAAGETVLVGNMDAGEMRALPTDQGVLRLRTGNAGGSVLVVAGVAYGPLGGDGRVRTLSLTPDEIAQALPELPAITSTIALEQTQ